MSGAARAVRWLPREPPLRPGALFAPCDAVQALLRRLAELAAEQRSQLWGLASPGGVFVQGPTEALPWVRGGTYLARTDEAPGLWMPTHRRPDVPIDLYARALRRAMQRPRGELAVLPADGRVAILGAPRPLDTAWLASAVDSTADPSDP